MQNKEGSRVILARGSALRPHGVPCTMPILIPHGIPSGFVFSVLTCPPELGTEGRVTDFSFLFSYANIQFKR